MQKKLIALAVAGLISGGAYADASNVTIYGILDLNVANGNSGYGGKTTIGSGGFSASRIGFKGTEDLGNGNSAIWVLEAGISADNMSVGNAAPAFGINKTAASTSGANGTGGQIFARTGYAGLQGNWGSVTLGRQYTASYLGLAAIMDLAGGGLYGNTGQLAPVGMATRTDNSIIYKTPNMSGFTGQILYTSGAENNTNTDVGTTAATGCTAAQANVLALANIPGFVAGTPSPYLGSSLCANPSTTLTNDKAGRGWDLGLTYANGPLVAILTTWNFNNATYSTAVAAGRPAGTVGETGLAKKTGWQLAGNYDFKVVKVFAGYLAGKIKDNGYEQNTAAFSDTSAYDLGIIVPIGMGNIGVNYGHFNDKSILDRDFNMWGISYWYDMSKRTTLYTSYGKVNNNSNSAQSLVTGGDVVGNINPASPGYDPSSFMVGMRHKF